MCKLFNAALLSLIISSIVLSGFSSAAAMIPLGVEAPDFTLKDVNGREIRLSGFKDRKAVVIVFWSTWSSFSSNALKRFEAFHRKYAGSGIQVVGINVDNQHISSDDMALIKDLISKLEITFPVLVDSRLMTFASYGVIALPSTFIIEAGKISYELPGLPLVGTEDMFDKLLVLAGETPFKQPAASYRPPYEAVADTHLAMRYAKKDNYASARLFFKKAIDKDPRYVLPYVELSRLYALEGKYSEAEDLLRRALEQDAANVSVESELGFLLSKSGKTKEGRELLEKTVKDGSYPQAGYYFAYALAMDGRLKESLAAFEEALAVNRLNREIYTLRAEVYEKNGRLKEAAADYEKSLELLLHPHL